MSSNNQYTANAMRIRYAIASLIAFVMGVAVLHAQVPMTGAGRGAPGATVAAVQAVDLGTAQTCAAGTSCNYTNLTITAALPNSALAVFVVNTDGGAGISGLSATWDSGGTNQGMTSVGTLLSGSFQSFAFGRLSPTAGNKTLALSWTGSATINVCAVSLKNVTQTSVAAAFTNATANLLNGTTVTNTVTSQVNDLVISGWNSTSFFSSFSGTQICLTGGGNVFVMSSSYDTGAASVAAQVTISGGANNIGALSLDVVHN